MPEIRYAPRLARNLALSAVAILITATVLTLAVLSPGGSAQACPGGEDWIVAAPAGASMAGYQTPGSAGSAEGGAAGTAVKTPPRTAPTSAAAEVAADQNPGTAGSLLLAGCVDTDRLHPVPISTDGRG